VEEKKREERRSNRLSVPRLTVRCEIAKDTRKKKREKQQPHGGGKRCLRKKTEQKKFLGKFD